MRKLKQGERKGTQDAIWQFMIDHYFDYKKDSGVYVFGIEATSKQNLWHRINTRMNGLYFTDEKKVFQKYKRYRDVKKDTTFIEKLVYKIFWRARNYLVKRNIEFY